ncbi:DeoR/GlpR transcriptional regulator [Vagococcus sp. BWB3-3]|uniref:DeoR/GlpR transcriptional regulator n=1 Tax=Vagococcus allomyrinae TaxID=2794353 RepID=A0A940SXU6_9ENTE|nr:DeoR/GlpR family DNA-binding transcription regulator [Vagococcus allomyrinae]MBP1042733.1 DeoR/GlpR transcriptional regulator [Vagococcus allomyrinae]
MLIEERLAKITQIIETKNQATIDYLAQELKVSKDTIRRDLIKLENKEIIKRIHGGAMLATREALIFDYSHRSTSLQEVKEKLARAAETLIENDATVIFDSSTTVEAIIPLVKAKNIQPITNSLTHALLFSQQQNKRVKVVGGHLHDEQLFLYGSETIEKLSQYRADITLLGIFAISAKGVFIHTEEEGFVKRTMVKQGRKVVALADHTKMDTKGFFKICGLEEIDVLITDRQPDSHFCKALANNNVDLIISEER